VPRTRVTLKDVAAASGVSATTASFVLNRVTGQTIPPATQERVRRAAAELGYVPHGSARALREGSSRLVLLNAGELPVAGSLRSFIDGLDAELSAHDHTLLVRHGRTGDAALRRATETADPRAVIDLARLYAADDPDRLDGGWIDGLAAHTATQIEYLAGLGHTRIGFAMPADDRLTRIARLRLQQARAVARAHGLPPPAVFTLDDHNTPTAAPAHSHKAGTHTTNTVTAGTGTAGTATAGTLAAGTATAGPDTTGTLAAGTGTAGTATAGTLAAGTATCGPDTTGTLAAGTGTARTVPAVTEDAVAAVTADAVTAVAAFDDETALRLLSAMADRGLTAPADIAVIGFDDTGHGEFWRPSLTTVRIDAEAYGRRAARAALGLPIGDTPPAPSVVVVRTTA
jgi:DNA-binding LacI/PurR family transcriptional regulator